MFFSDIHAGNNGEVGWEMKPLIIITGSSDEATKERRFTKNGSGVGFANYWWILAISGAVPNFVRFPCVFSLLIMSQMVSS